MALHDSSSESVHRQVPSMICHQWILEFDSLFAWDKVLESRSFGGNVKELLNGLVKRLELTGASGCGIHIGKEGYFLGLMAALAEMHSQNSSTEEDAQFTFGSGDSDEGSVFLQIQGQVLQLLDKLTDICFTDATKLLLPDIRQQTLLQCVYVNCRRGSYHDAEKFFKNYSAEFDKETNRKAEAVLHAKKKPHCWLASETFDSYLDKMIEFLQELHTSFQDRPFLLQLAHDVITLPKRYQNRKILSTHEIGPRSGEHPDTLEQKLATVRQKVRQEVASKARGSHGETTLRKSTSSKVTPRKSTPSPRKGTPRENTPSPKKGTRRKNTPSPSKGTLRKSTPRASKRTRNKGAQDVDFESDDVGRETPRSAKKRPRGGSGRENGEAPPTSDLTSASEYGSSEQEIEEMDSFEEDIHEKRSPGKQRPLTSHTVHLSLAPQSLDQRGVHTSRQKWTSQEEEEFYQLVQQYGVGAWIQIQQAWRTNRTNVMLKDKWRTILKTSYKELCDKFGPVDLVAD